MCHNDSQIENGMFLGVSPFCTLERGPRFDDDGDFFFEDDCEDFCDGFPWEEASNA